VADSQNTPFLVWQNPNPPQRGMVYEYAGKYLYLTYQGVTYRFLADPLGRWA
jgi:hypothetical protein